MTQRSKSAFASLYGSSGSLFPDNTSGDIGEEDVRAQGEDIKDSFFNTIDDAYIGAKGLKNSVNTIANLKAVVTVGLSVPLYTIFRDTSNSDVLRVYELVSGTNAEASPTIIRPNDYAGTTNEKVWKLAVNDPSSGGLNWTTITIGDWDMDATLSVSVAHGLADITKIRCINIIIRNDNDTVLSPIDRTDATTFDGVQGGVFGIDTTEIVIGRKLLGSFDTTNYDSTSYNRGWVTIGYVS